MSIRQPGRDVKQAVESGLKDGGVRSGVISIRVVFRALRPDETILRALERD